MTALPYPAPSFSLPDDTGNVHSLSDYAGTWLVLYFYPKDDTPGCTTQACSLRDARDDLTDLGAVVVGISKDTPSDHEKFKAKYNLNFTLLSDTEGSVIEAYGAWGPKMFGQVGIQRKTFLIDPALNAVAAEWLYCADTGVDGPQLLLGTGLELRRSTR